MARAGHSKQKGNRSEEFLEVVDRSNTPIAVLPRTQVHLQGLFHRSVVILVYDRKGRILLTKRAKDKFPYPDRWDLSATGHVWAREAVRDAALRELKEETGLVPLWLKLLQIIAGCEETNLEFVYVFSAGNARSRIQGNAAEVQDHAFLSREELKTMVEKHPENLTPALVYLWEKGLVFE